MKEVSGMSFIRSLSDKEKSDLFNIIAEKYYNANFGSLGKGQSDLLMFSIYLDKLIDKNKSFDDYTISKQLGILQTTVRQLKKKKQLIYPLNYNWYDSFLEYSKTAVFDGSGRIMISVPDPNVYIELQHAIEELGGFVEIQLNSKLLKIPPGYYIELLLKIYQKEGADDKTVKKMRDNLINELNKKCLNDAKINDKLTEKTFATKLKEQGLEVALDILKDMIPGGSAIMKTITTLSTKLFE